MSFINDIHNSYGNFLRGVAPQGLTHFAEGVVQGINNLNPWGPGSQAGVEVVQQAAGEALSFFGPANCLGQQCGFSNQTMAVGAGMGSVCALDAAGCVGDQCVDAVAPGMRGLVGVGLVALAIYGDYRAAKEDQPKVETKKDPLHSTIKGNNSIEKNPNTTSKVKIQKKVQFSSMNQIKKIEPRKPLRKSPRNK